MTSSKHITLPPLPVYEDYLAASAVIDDYLEDLLLPAFNQLRAAYGIEPAPAPNRPPVTPDEAAAAGKKYKAYWEALEAQTRREKALRMQDEGPRPNKPRKTTLAKVAKQASKAGIDPIRIEIKPDGSYVVDIGKPEPVEPGNPWPLDEFRTKETKQ